MAGFVSAEPTADRELPRGVPRLEGSLSRGRREDDGLQRLWEDGERVFCRGSRPGANGSPVSVLIAMPAAEQPSPATVERFGNEYALRDELDRAWAVRPLELGRERGRPVLVLEDPGGEPLDRLLDAPMEPGNFLRLALGLAEAVAGLHRRGLIHKDIKPWHILVDPSGTAVRLTGFGLASRLPRERPAADPPEVIAGTLAYMAPEQTGRMNRSVDTRSDLYAVGVVLYQMLTGNLPFSAAEPMEWVHCHIARRPEPPDQLVPGLPPVLTAIVMKLLAKTGEERYQTAAGLAADLRRCLTDWQRHGRIAPFVPGTGDIPDRLRIPEKLYGREREVGRLLSAFARVVAEGRPELVLVAGHAGIGKSAVVNELHKALVPPRGLFAAGKSDQHKRDVPYATLAQACRGLTRMLLVKSNAELGSWRDALREALGPNGRLILDLVPELRLIVDEQPPVPELEPQQAQGRFHLVFRRFLGVFARPEHPLALFLDDLQWLDAATLDLLGDLLTQPDVRHLLLIGAYRDNEADAAHPLMRKLAALRQTEAGVQTIGLPPLAPGDLGRLLADALHCAPEHAAPLAQLAQEKTAGNPFFAIQFLAALAEEGLLTFEHGAARWSWDLDRIHAKGYTDNVVDLMVGKLTRLPVATRTALQHLACLGNVAGIATLCLVCGASEPAVDADLWEAVRQELILRLDGAYRFVHDRVQEAAYSLIPEESRAPAHLRVGRLLVAQTPPERREEAIFEIVNQINRGAALLASREDRQQAAELNLLAGRRAKQATAYASALTYLAAGCALLPEDCWERCAALAFALEVLRAECEFLTGALAAAENRLSMLSPRAADTVQRVAVACLQLDLYVTRDQSGRAVAVGLDQLRHLGIAWSPHPTDEEAQREYGLVLSQIGSRTIEVLAGLPLMSDPASLATLDILTRLVPAALFTDANLYALTTCRAVRLSLERGYNDGSCPHFEWLGLVAGTRFGDYDVGFRLGQVGCRLVAQRGLKRYEARTYMLFGAHVLPWSRHVRAGRDVLRHAFESAKSSGDLTFAQYSRFNLTTILLAAGEHLGEVQREAEASLDYARMVPFVSVMTIMTTQLGLIGALRGLPHEFGAFDDAKVDDARTEQRFSGTSGLTPTAVCWHWIRKLQVRCLAGHHTAALEALSRAEPLIWATASMFEMAEYHFYAALARAAACGSEAGRQQHFAALAAHHRQLEIWAENCPETFENRAALVGAEIARIEGRPLDAMELYQQAIRSARDNGFVHNEAIAYERAAAFYRARGFDEFADLYLRNARFCYLRWGADGKVRQLDDMYPHLGTAEPAPGPTTTIAAPVEHLDLATVIKVSQAVSGDIVHEKLIETLMRTAIEQAGAERGLLLLARAGEPRIEAEASTTGGTVTVHPRDQAVAGTMLPESVLNQVLRTRESVILDDAAAQSAFAADPYIRQRQVRSVLCLPLLNRAKLIGVLYLENNLAARVFAPGRSAVLKLLASQAAISLENSDLYRDLAEREARIRRLVDANIVGIFIWDFDGRILEANEAFLRTVGYDREDLVSGRMRWTEMTPSHWHERDVEWLQEHRRTGLRRPIEKEYFRKDGSRVPVLMGAATFGEGETQGVAFVLDLTERKQAEAALRQSEQRFRTLVQFSFDVYWESDARHRFVRQQFAEGLADAPAPGSEIGKTRWDVPSLEPDEEAWRKHRETLDAHLPFRDFELARPMPNGGKRYVSVSGLPVFDETGRFVGYRGVGRHITERKRAEEALRTMQMELAHANRVATLGQLTASIAHEVNQPIAATLTNAEAALRWLGAERPDLGEVRQALGRIVRDASRAGAVVHRIRNFSRKAPSRTDRVEINAAIREVIELTRGEAMKHGVAVRTDLAEGLPPIDGDRAELQQVILNLILNAVEAMREMREGSRDLLIGTGKTESGDVLVSVRDSGPGLAPAALEHLFVAFHTTKPNGLGLGLSICRSIVESHGGRLWAEANQPRGAAFRFTVPAVPTAGS
jgi:PAS domain S-box-containing protein